MRPSSRITPSRAVALVGAFLLSACGSLTEAVALSQYGSISISGRSQGTAQARATATAIFFESGNLSVPNSARQQSDQCLIAAIDTATSVVRGQKNVGNVTVTSAGATLPLAFADAFARYELATTSSLTYRPGDNAVVTIPGGSGFPSTSIAVRLAEPIVPGAITVPAAGQPMTVTWNATNDTTSAVIVALRYAFPATSTYPNEQVYCAVRDDGTFEVPAAAMTAFLGSPNALRSLRLTRWRTNFLQPNLATTLHVATSVDTVVVFP
ncbi:MAG: hypothetical protein LCH84_12520 [Gemmatimonadetes bacterium]|nr:hypothetical protein [Gemmatimonadota bacterium]